MKELIFSTNITSSQGWRWKQSKTRHISYHMVIKNLNRPSGKSVESTFLWIKPGLSWKIDTSKYSSEVQLSDNYVWCLVKCKAIRYRISRQPKWLWTAWIYKYMKNNRIIWLNIRKGLKKTLKKYSPLDRNKALNISYSYKCHIIISKWKHLGHINHCCCYCCK